MSELKPFQVADLSLIGIKVMEAHLKNNHEFQSTMEDEVAGFNVNTNVDHSIFPEGEQFYLTLSLDVEAYDHEEKAIELSCSMKIQFLFLINDFDEYILHTNDKVKEVQSTLLSSMAAISYSTARGIFYTRTLGTPMEGSILPIIPPADLLKK